MTVIQIASLFNMTRDAIYKRLNNGKKIDWLIVNFFRNLTYTKYKELLDRVNG